MNVIACAVLFGAVAFSAWCLQVIPERANVVSFNKKYLADLKFYVKRHGRKSKYCINLEGTTKHVWENNISANLVFYEYLHNEYKRSFVEMKFKYCDLVSKDPYIGQALAATGVPCPAPPGYYKLNNMSIPMDKFPNVWPFERCKVDIILTQLPTQDFISNFELFLLFKQ